MALKRRKKRNIYIDVIDTITAFGLKLSAVAFVLALGYLIYGLLSRDGILKLGGLPQADQARVLANVASTCRVLSISGLVLSLCLAVRYYVEEALGYMMSFLGVLLYFGAIPSFENWFGRLAGTQAGKAVWLIAHEFQLLGIVFFAPGAVLVIRDIILRVRLALAQSAKEKYQDGSFIVGEQPEIVEEPYKPRLYAKCFQTPYCRGFVRNTCPMFEKRKSCWRKKSGCMCDPAIIERALRSQSSESRAFMRDLQFRLGDVPGKKKRELTGAEKRQRCRMCIIYDFHQKQKYKIVSPLVFPIVGGLIWGSYPAIAQFTLAAVNAADKFMQKMSFLPHAADKTPVGVAVPQIVLVLFVVWLTIIAISYSLHFVEFCIFKLKI